MSNRIDGYVCCVQPKEQEFVPRQLRLCEMAGIDAQLLSLILLRLQDYYRWTGRGVTNSCLEPTLVYIVCAGRRRCKNRLPQGRSSLASTPMAGSNSVFNAPLELKSCRLPMPPSSGSRIHPSRCFCPLPAAPNANNLALEFKQACFRSKSDSVFQRSAKTTLWECAASLSPK